MAIKVLHTSDWHLGKTLFEAPLLEDQRHALAQVLRMLVEEEPDVLLVAGDIFDRSIPPEDAVSLLGEWLQQARAAAPATPIVLIAGNHDSGARLAWAAGLLAAGGVYIRANPAEVGEPVRLVARSGERVEVWCVPFLWPGAFGTGEGEAPVGQVGAFEAALARIEPLRTPGVAQVLVAHCFTQGGRTSQSERTLVGQATLIDPGRFAGYDYVALGHLHRPQAVAANAHYSGSLARYSFSEAEDEKAVLRVEVCAGAAPVVRPLPLVPRRPMRRIQGRLADLMVDPALDAVREAYLEVTLTTPEVLGNPVALLRTRFPLLLQLLNPEAEAALGEAPPAGDRLGGERTLSGDLEEFYAHIHQRAPEEPVAAAFRALHARLAAAGSVG